MSDLHIHITIAKTDSFANFLLKNVHFNQQVPGFTIIAS